MMNMTSMILIALFIEAIVGAVKPLWNREGSRMSVTEIVSIVIGVALAVSCRINALEYLIDYQIALDAPGWVQYVFYVLSGIALGRGPSFIHDLIVSLREWANRGQEGKENG